MKEITGVCVRSDGYRKDLTVNKKYLLTPYSNAHTIENSSLVNFTGNSGKICAAYKHRFKIGIQYTKLKLI